MAGAGPRRTGTAPPKHVVRAVVAMVGGDATELLARHWPGDTPGLVQAVRARVPGKVGTREWGALVEAVEGGVPGPAAPAPQGRSPRRASPQPSQQHVALAVQGIETAQRDLAAREAAVAAEERALGALKSEIDLHEQHLAAREADVARREHAADVLAAENLALRDGKPILSRDETVEHIVSDRFRRLIDENNALQAERDRLATRVAEADDAATAPDGAALAAVEEAAAEVARLEAAVEAARQLNGELEARVEAMGARQRDDAAALHAVRQEAAGLREQLACSEDERRRQEDQAARQQSRHDEEVRRMKDFMDGLRADIEGDRERAHAAAQAGAKERQKLLDDTASERQRLLSLIDLEKAACDTRMKTSQLAHDAEKQQLQADLAAALDDAAAKHARTQALLDDANTALEKAKADARVARTLDDQARALLADNAAAELAQVQLEAAESRRGAARLENDLESARARADAVQEELDEHRATLGAVQAALDGARGEHEAATAELAAVKGDLEAARAELRAPVAALIEVRGEAYTQVRVPSYTELVGAAGLRGEGCEVATPLTAGDAPNAATETPVAGGVSVDLFAIDAAPVMLPAAVVGEATATELAAIEEIECMKAELEAAQAALAAATTAAPAGSTIALSEVVGTAYAHPVALTYTQAVDAAGLRGAAAPEMTIAAAPLAEAKVELHGVAAAPLAVPAVDCAADAAAERAELLAAHAEELQQAVDSVRRKGEEAAKDLADRLDLAEQQLTDREETHAEALERMKAELTAGHAAETAALDQQIADHRAVEAKRQAVEETIRKECEEMAKEFAARLQDIEEERKSIKEASAAHDRATSELKAQHEAEKAAFATQLEEQRELYEHRVHEASTTGPTTTDTAALQQQLKVVTDERDAARRTLAYRLQCESDAPRLWDLERRTALDVAGARAETALWELVTEWYEGLVVAVDEALEGAAARAAVARTQHAGVDVEHEEATQRCDGLVEEMEAVHGIALSMSLAAAELGAADREREAVAKWEVEREAVVANAGVLEEAVLQLKAALEDAKAECERLKEELAEVKEMHEESLADVQEQATFDQNMIRRKLEQEQLDLQCAVTKLRGQYDDVSAQLAAERAARDTSIQSVEGARLDLEQTRTQLAERTAVVTNQRRVVDAVSTGLATCISSILERERAGHVPPAGESGSAAQGALTVAAVRRRNHVARALQTSEYLCGEKLLGGGAGATAPGGMLPLTEETAGVVGEMLCRAAETPPCPTVMDELAANLHPPPGDGGGGVDHVRAMLTTAAGEFWRRAQDDPMLAEVAPVEALVLGLYTLTGEDTDRLLGWDDAAIAAAAPPARNVALADALDAALRGACDAAARGPDPDPPAALVRWIKTLTLLTGVCVRPGCWDSPLLMLVDDVEDTAATALFDAGVPSITCPQPQSCTTDAGVIDAVCHAKPSGRKTTLLVLAASVGVPLRAVSKYPVEAQAVLPPMACLAVQRQHAWGADTNAEAASADGTASATVPGAPPGYQGAVVSVQVIPRLSADLRRVCAKAREEAQAYPLEAGAVAERQPTAAADTPLATAESAMRTSLDALRTTGDEAAALCALLAQQNTALRRERDLVRAVVCAAAQAGRARDGHAAGGLLPPSFPPAAAPAAAKYSLLDISIAHPALGIVPTPAGVGAAGGATRRRTRSSSLRAPHATWRGHADHALTEALTLDVDVGGLVDTLCAAWIGRAAAEEAADRLTAWVQRQVSEERTRLHREAGGGVDDAVFTPETAQQLKASLDAAVGTHEGDGSSAARAQHLLEYYTARERAVSGAVATRAASTRAASVERAAAGAAAVSALHMAAVAHFAGLAEVEHAAFDAQRDVFAGACCAVVGATRRALRGTAFAAVDVPLGTGAWYAFLDPAGREAVHTALARDIAANLSFPTWTVAPPVAPALLPRVVVAAGVPGVADRPRPGVVVAITVPEGWKDAVAAMGPTAEAGAEAGAAGFTLAPDTAEEAVATVGDLAERGRLSLFLTHRAVEEHGGLIAAAAAATPSTAAGLLSPDIAALASAEAAAAAAHPHPAAAPREALIPEGTLLAERSVWEAKLKALADEKAVLLEAQARLDNELRASRGEGDAAATPRPAGDGVRGEVADLEARVASLTTARDALREDRQRLEAELLVAGEAERALQADLQALSIKHDERVGEVIFAAEQTTALKDMHVAAEAEIVRLVAMLEVYEADVAALRAGSDEHAARAATAALLQAETSTKLAATEIELREAHAALKKSHAKLGDVEFELRTVKLELANASGGGAGAAGLVAGTPSSMSQSSAEDVALGVDAEGIPGDGGAALLRGDTGGAAIAAVLKQFSAAACALARTTPHVKHLSSFVTGKLRQRGDGEISGLPAEAADDFEAVAAHPVVLSPLRAAGRVGGGTGIQAVVEEEVQTLVAGIDALTGEVTRACTALRHFDPIVRRLEDDNATLRDTVAELGKVVETTIKEAERALEKERAAKALALAAEDNLRDAEAALVQRVSDITGLEVELAALKKHHGMHGAQAGVAKSVKSATAGGGDQGDPAGGMYTPRTMYSDPSAPASPMSMHSATSPKAVLAAAARGLAVDAATGPMSPAAGGEGGGKDATAATARIAALETHISLLEGEVREVRADLMQAEASAAVQRRECDALRKEIAQAVADADAARTDTLRARGLHQGLQEQLGQERERIEAMRQQAHELSHELQVAQQHRKDLQAEVARLLPLRVASTAAAVVTAGTPAADVVSRAEKLAALTTAQISAALNIEKAKREDAEAAVEEQARQAAAATASFLAALAAPRVASTATGGATYTPAPVPAQVP